MSLSPPDAIRTRYSSLTWTVVSEWPGVSTAWRLEDSTGHEVMFLKVVVSGHYPTALGEAERTRWAGSYLPVPAVIDTGSDNDVDWLLTTAIGGVDATRHRLIEDPGTLVPAIARSLAAFHAAAPVEPCPFVFDVRTALAHAHERARRGIATAADFHPEHAHLTIEGALAELERLTPETEHLVVCHGDYCFPNLLFDLEGEFTGYVDLGELAVADRWWDIAVGAWSTTWNLGPGWESAFYESYGIEPDPDRIAFFRLLYDLAS